MPATKQAGSETGRQPARHAGNQHGRQLAEGGLAERAAAAAVPAVLLCG